MKYPGDISGEEYAAMEEGYEQGYEQGVTAARAAHARRRTQSAEVTAVLARLRTRGSAQVTVDGTVYEIRCLLLRHDPSDPSIEEPVLRLGDVELLLAAFATPSDPI